MDGVHEKYSTFSHTSVGGNSGHPDPPHHISGVGVYGTCRTSYSILTTVYLYHLRLIRILTIIDVDGEGLEERRSSCT